ncbi:hypothetical protein IJJ36_03415 [Candidatus Saccharibacteria bacterium]|nr:hypothetical protein [Candidatus Saccharibacteria bacterium]
MNSTNASKSSIFVFLALLSLLVLLYFVALRRKNNKIHFSTEDSISSKVSNLIIFILPIATTMAAFMLMREEAKVFADFGSSNTTINTSEEVNITVEKGGEITVGDGIVSMRTDAKSFKLYAYVKNSDRVKDGSNNYIDSISQGGTILDENVWGYRVGDDNFSGLPIVNTSNTKGQLIVERILANGTDKQAEVDISYGIKANNNLATGLYEGTISYTVLTDISSSGSGSAEISGPTTISNTGGDTINIKTSLQEYGDMDLGIPIVNIGSKTCTSAQIQRDNIGFINISCVLPQSDTGRQDVSISIPDIDWSFTITNGVDVVDTGAGARIISAGNTSCALYIGITNKARENSQCLQSVIDAAHNIGVQNNNTQQTVYVPKGEYYFAWTGFRTRKQNGEFVYDTSNEYYCIKLRSYVKIVGESGKSVIDDSINSNNFTIFYPYDGSEFYDDSSLPDETRSRVDMFYFNDYADNSFADGSDTYLVDADFEDFVIDGRYTTSSAIDSSAGKGFMVNLFRDCDWDNVAVLNTDGTGFGMDCPINSTISNSLAVGCGKGVGTSGHAGFGIGTGYADDEDLIIQDSRAYYNGQYGFFFEHQGKWRNNGTVYPARIIGNDSVFIVENSFAGLNAYDYGGERAYNLYYDGNESNESNGYRTYVSTNSLKREHALSPVLLSDLSTNIYIDSLNITRNEYGDLDNRINDANWALSKGITTLESATDFGADNSISRGEALSMLWRYFNHTNESLEGSNSYLYHNNPTVYYIEPIANFGGNDYKVIPKIDHSDSSDKYIATDWAIDNDISNGDGRDPSGALMMDLDNDCSRIDFIIFLYRFSGEDVMDVIPVEYSDLDAYLRTLFVDADDIRVARGDIGVDAASWAAYRAIVNGVGSGNLDPEGTLKKIDAVTMLYRYNDNDNITVKP